LTSSSSVLRGWDDIVVIVCAPDVSPSCDFSVFGFAGRHQKNEIGSGVVDFGVPFTTNPASPPRGARSFGDGGDRYCYCLLVSGSSVACHDCDPLLHPLLSRQIPRFPRSTWVETCRPLPPIQYI
jgi:hypothetical protein